MGSLSARADRARRPALTRASRAAAAVLALVGRPAAAPSLCLAAETNLFSCPMGGKLVSVCGGAAGRGATYRFGRPGRVELQSGALTRAVRGFAGGGETQMSFTRNGVRYVIYQGTYRTSFGASGQHDAQDRAGLVVQRGGRTVMDRRCAGSPTINGDLSRYVPAGRFVEH